MRSFADDNRSLRHHLAATKHLSGAALSASGLRGSGSLASWPRLSLSQVPALTDAAAMATEIRALVLPTRPSSPLQGFTRIAQAGRFVISQETLSAALGQEEALLIPLDGDRFSICVDPTPSGGWARIKPRLRRELRRQRHRFRVAHEIAHTLFYDRGGERPRRRFPGSDQEEAFCDEFARSLLVPRAVARKCGLTPSAVFSLHSSYDVSVEVAARAIAAAQPGVEVAVWYEDPNHALLLQWSNVSGARAEQIRPSADFNSERGQAVAVRRPGVHR